MESRFSIRHKFNFPYIKNKQYIDNNKVLIIFLICFIIVGFFLLINSMSNMMLPSIITFSEAKVQSVVANVSNEKIKAVLKELGISNLISLQSDDNKNITALQANIIEMNQLSVRVTAEIEKELNVDKPIYVSVPIGNLFNNSFLANRGPSISIKLLTYGKVNTEFKTEFETAGINQTRHKIYLEVTTDVLIILPGVRKSFTTSTKVPVSETVIVGDVPQSFFEYNNKLKSLTGVEE